MKKDLRSPNYKQWDLPESAKARLGTGYITGKIVYSPDGTQLVVPKSTGIWVYDASTLEVIDFISEYRAFDSRVIRNDQWSELIEVDNAVGFGTEGKLFVVRVAWGRVVFEGPSEVYTLRIWSKEIEQPALIFLECSEKMDSMVFSPDGSTLAGSKDGTIYLWNVHTGKLQNTFTLGAGKIDSIVFSPDGSTFASTRTTGTGQFISSESDSETYEYIDSDIDIWDTRTGSHKFNLYANSFLGFSPDGQMLAVNTEHSVALWEVNTGICKFDFIRYHPSVLHPYSTTPSHSYTDTSDLGNASSLAFSHDGITLASYSRGRVNKIQLWDYDTGNCKSTFTGIDRITSLVFSPDADGFTLAAGCDDGTVLLWNVDSADGETTFNVNMAKNETKLTEENTEFQNSASQIQQFCEERGITTLCHFTRIENLHSILQEGLLGRSPLETRGQEFLFNDDDRADGHKEAVCLSISFPNYQMFYSIREEKKETQEASDSQWIVLLLDAKVLWGLNCAFCQNNAARKTISRTSLEDRKSPEALKGMFGDFYNIRHQDLQIPDPYLMHPKDAYPTHPQAEVLVFGSIPGQFIKAIHFWDETTLEKCRTSYAEKYSQMLFVNRQYFTYRPDYEVWRREKFDDEGIPLSYTAENNVDGIPLQPQETPVQTPVPDHLLVANLDFEVDPNDPFVDPDDEDDIPF
ncbi:MAG: DarT ssDNA thymidine ADP-ribosyltransferase family protein [Candidatus Poribacteria bacterium]|nr:DarT ssDNA thymidine ADP-ribosyltransferase family protein [Candidatus Poribacteria bacterium]